MVIKVTPRQIRQVASTLVQLERWSGRLKKAKDLDIKCADCDELATCYDHRDYTKALELVPVCASCNSKRGQACPRLDGEEVIDVDWSPDGPEMFLFNFFFPADSGVLEQAKATTLIADPAWNPDPIVEDALIKLGSIDENGVLDD